MKKSALISLVPILLILCMSLCACESDADRELRKTEEAISALEDQLEQAEEDYYELQRTIDDYNDAAGRLNP